MTPKEKAKELFDKFYMAIPSDEMGLCDEASRLCALIAVEFAREQFYKYCCAEMGTVGTYDDHFDVLRQEIEKL